MFDEAGEDFHQSALERALRFGNAVPRWHRYRARREFGVGRNPAQLLLAREYALPIGVPAVVELAFVLVGPFLEDLVRPVTGTRRPVEEERLVRREGLMPAQPVDAALREVFAQMIPFVLRRLDLVGVLDEARFPLRGFAGEEAVEIVEPMSVSAGGLRCSRV